MRGLRSEVSAVAAQGGPQREAGGGGGGGWGSWVLRRDALRVCRKQPGQDPVCVPCASLQRRMEDV